MSEGRLHRPGCSGGQGRLRLHLRVPAGPGAMTGLHSTSGESNLDAEPSPWHDGAGAIGVNVIARDRAFARALPAVAVLAGLAFAGSSSPETDGLVEALALREGMTIADVGAGDGEWTERLARRVGPTGHVFATEVDEAEIGKIEERVGEAGLENVTTVLGSAVDTGLPEGCCEAVLLRMVYHHFTQPAEMRASLRRALRSGARLVVIDTEPQTGWSEVAGVPDRGGHGIRQVDLEGEMVADGFAVVARYEAWDGRGDRYCVVFRPENRR